MSESLAVWIALIGFLSVALGAARGVMLRSRGFVPRGRKRVAKPLPPSPAGAATARDRARRSRPRVGSAPGAAQPGLAR
ncbi:MAG: hypothetical protein WEF50_17835 [Myxococcota bacterium]